ncbi:MAG: hypothetical protein GY953_32665 [bacterium]|nr:hypothetical protein [bacterium]
MLTTTNNVCASVVLSTRDLNMRPEQDLAEIVGRFLRVGEAVVAHWVEFTRGLLLFVMAAEDELSGEFYVYERRKGRFWLLSLPDEVLGGYSPDQMRQKIRDFGLLELAENPARLLLCSR